MATTLYDCLFLAAADQVRIALLTLNRTRYGLAKAKFSVKML
ncbi:MAG: hypothetical protein ACP5OU_02490 [Methanothrix sp.]